MRICDFEGARPIGKPKDWVEELDGECGTIYVTDSRDLQSGLPIMYSVYKLEDEEIEALKNGGLLRLGIIGHGGHTFFQLGVLSPDITNGIEVTPKGDLGGVITDA